MAIDMIERTDEGVHATSRLGNFQFADESKDFKNFTGGEDFFQGGGEDWANLWGINIFGDEYYKKRKRESTEQGKKFVAELPMKDRNAPTCDEIAKSLEQLLIYSETQIKEIGASKGHVVNYPKLRLEEARKEEARLKLLQSKKDCIAIAEKEKADTAKAETLKTITELSEQSVQSAKKDLLGVNEALSQQAPQGESTMNKNLMLYGGIGLGAILLILLLRRN